MSESDDAPTRIPRRGKPRVEITSYACQGEKAWKADCPSLRCWYAGAPTAEWALIQFLNVAIMFGHPGEKSDYRIVRERFIKGRRVLK